MNAATVGPTRYEASREDIAELLAAEPRYRIEQIWNGLYQRLAEPEEMTDLPAGLRKALATALPAALDLRTESVSDRGDTVKFLWELAGAARVETVLMLYPDRATVCVSSQAGCAMGCGFCATGQAGFSRHLTTGEIVEQVVRASRRARSSGRRVSNVVFMGMGEPLANEAAVWAAVERHARRDGAVGPAHHHLDGGHRSRHPPARRAEAAGHLGGEPPRRQRRPPGRAGPDQSALPDRGLARRVR